MTGKRRPDKQREDLALAIAIGGTTAEWARSNNVPERTARRWVASPGFKATVDAHRKAIVDRTLGGLIRFNLEAVQTIANLMRNSTNDSVKLSASRTFIEQTMELADWHELRERVEDLERRIHAKKSGDGEPAEED